MFEKLNNAKSFSQNTRITRKDNYRIIPIRLKQVCKSLFSKIASAFGYQTLEKTSMLVRKQLFPSIETSSSSRDEKTATRSTILKLLKNERKNHPQKRIVLNEILQENGYSTVIKGEIFENQKVFIDVDFKGIRFQDCYFDWFHFSGSSFNEVIFQNCTLNNTSFMNTSLEKCSFDHCIMQEVMFTGANLNDTTFASSNLLGNSFEDASIENSSFSNVNMPGTHFFEAQVRNSTISESNLQNTVFFETQEYFIIDSDSQNTHNHTAPISATLVDPENNYDTTSKSYVKLEDQSHTIPILITLQPQKIDVSKLSSQVERFLDEIEECNERKSPIPQQLFNKIRESSEDNEAFKIFKKARALAAREVNVFFLPGGDEEIPLRLFGEKNTPKTQLPVDYRRSLFTLALVHHSFNQGIPLMATCLGFQTANVYFGAKVEQHTPNQMGVQKYKSLKKTHKGLLHKAFDRPILGLAWHYQGISAKRADEIQHLESMVIYNNLIKASEVTYSGATPMILLQFHPECYKSDAAESKIQVIYDKFLKIILSKKNDYFWKILSDSAQAHKNKRLALKELMMKPPVLKKIPFQP